MPETLACPPEEWYSSDDVREEMLFGYRRPFADEIVLSRSFASRPRMTEEVSLPGAQRLISEISEATRESQGMGLARVDEDTEKMAAKLAAQLPASIPMPEVAVDPDGEISFDWLGKEGKIFSVSIGRNGRLAYAGRFGENSKINGVDQLSEACPPEILLGVGRVVS